MLPHRASSLALHICADVLNAEAYKHWPRPVAAQDTVRRLSRVCQRAGVLEQQTLSGERATSAALIDTLLHASSTLASDGLFVLTFSGHTERGGGSIGTARWCLCDGGVELLQIVQYLAVLPRTARLAIVADTCYAAAIVGALSEARETLVVAGCREDQTMIFRASSEFIVRLEDFVCSPRRDDSLADLRLVLEADTPDCERPCIWTNSDLWWSRRPLDVFVPFVPTSATTRRHA